MTPDRRRPIKQSYVVGAAWSVGCHVLIVAALLTAHGEAAPKHIEQVPIVVTMIEMPKPPPPPPPPVETEAPAHAKPPPPRTTLVKPKPATHTDVKPLPAAKAPVAVAAVAPGPSGNGISDSQIADAGTADGGGAGAGCDMARKVQSALRRDSLVRNAVSSSSGKALMVWDGDWVRGNGEDGKGLAAVREAILWEVAFAPAECRKQPVHGLVLISLNGAGGPVRLGIGSGEWRWADLLHPRRGY